MALLQAIRMQLSWQRRLVQVLASLLLATGSVALLLALHAGPAVLRALSTRDLLALMQLLGTVALLLVPISGVISTSSQFAFWTGWLAGLPQPGTIFPPAPEGGQQASQNKTCTIVYLDGIHQSEQDHPPRVEAFLEQLQRRLPAHVRLLKGLETYTVTKARLADDTWGSWFWQRLFALQEHHPNSAVSTLCAVLVQANNVIKVGISSDRRYGPILNYELALKMGQRLAEVGFQPGPVGPDGPQELVMLGYSGGGEMAMGVADYLRRICRCPVRIITFCGVFSGNQLLEEVSRIAMVVGSADPVAAFGRIAYPGRSPLLPLSNWNRAVGRGQVTRHWITGLSHNGARGPFAQRYRGAVIEAILTALQQRATRGAD